MKQFLIVKTSAIGDVIHTFPVANYLKKQFPHCLIDWVVEKAVAPLVKAHPDLRHIYVADTQTWRKSPISHCQEIRTFLKELRQNEYDALFDFQGNTKSGIITAFAKAKQKVGYGWKCTPEKPNYLATNVHIPIIEEGNIRKRYLQMVKNYVGIDEEPADQPIQFSLTHEERCHLERLKTLGFQRPRFMVCFGSHWKNKQLSDETLINFLHHFEDNISSTFFFIYGNEKENAFADQLEREFRGKSHTVGKISVPLWQRFMQEVDGVIAMDSAALHLCGTTATPSFSLFGPSSALTYKPLGGRHRAFQGICPYGVQFDKRCPNLRTCKTGACLKNLSGELLFDQFQQFWSKVSHHLGPLDASVQLR